MQSREFIDQALKTEFVPSSLAMSPVDLRNILCMAVACSDILDKVKKMIIYGKQMDSVALAINVAELTAAAKYLERHMPVSGQTTNDRINIRLLHAAIGIFTESGEMLEALMKQLTTGELDMVNVSEEIGDVHWYSAIAVDEVEIPEERIRQTLINKLAKRYPEKFTQEAALNRDLKSERKVLEEGLSC